MTEEVLVLDFGGQYSQLIARRIRECGVFAELLPHDTELERIRERRPAALVLSGGPASVYSDGRTGAAPRAARARRPGAGHLLRDAGDGPRPRRPGRRRRRGRVRAHLAGPRRRRRAVAVRVAARAAMLDEPPRQRLRAAGGLRRARLQPRVAGGRVRESRAGPVRDPVPSRGRSHALRHPDSRSLPAPGRGPRAALVSRLGDRRAGRRGARPGRRGGSDLRALGRRRLGDRRGARPPRGRRSAHLRPRRPRAAAQERGRAGGRGLSRPRDKARPRGRSGTLPEAARRGGRARKQAQDHRRGVHPRVRGAGGEASGCPVPGPGDPVLRRDRVGRGRTGRGGDDQVAPQRRRSSRGPGPRARRAAPDAVQGRGSRGRHRARPAGANRLAPAVPRSRVSGFASSAAR